MALKTKRFFCKLQFSRSMPFPINHLRLVPAVACVACVYVCGWAKMDFLIESQKAFSLLSDPSKGIQFPQSPRDRPQWSGLPLINHDFFSPQLARLLQTNTRKSQEHKSHRQSTFMLSSKVKNSLFCRPMSYIRIESRAFCRAQRDFFYFAAQLKFKVINGQLSHCRSKSNSTSCQGVIG